MSDIKIQYAPFAASANPTDRVPASQGNGLATTISVQQILDKGPTSLPASDVSAWAKAAVKPAYTKSEVGLPNVDNTSDANKPVSSATQTALDSKVDDAQVLTNVPLGAVFTDTVYTHPVNHPPSIITQDTSNRFVTDVEKALWASKEPGNANIQLHISSTSNPHGVTATQVNLGNVTNESKTTMFTSPTFTGMVSGVSASMVGLGNVTNDTQVKRIEMGAALGVATLDSGGKVPVAQLPSSLMIYKGVWNATTNTPALSDLTGTAGHVYRVTVAGTQDLGSGAIIYAVGDYAIHNGVSWEKSDTTDSVPTVFGRTGNVVAAAGDYTADQITETATRVFVTPAQKTVLGNTSGTNTGDQVLSGLVPNTRTINAKALTTNITLTSTDIGADPAGTASGLIATHNLTYTHSDIALNTAARHTHTNSAALAVVSGTNTGDNAANSLYSSLVSNATHTGDATGATALTVVALNGTNLAALATGILKNTTGTGVPSIAVASDFPTLNQNTTGTAASITGLTASIAELNYVAGVTSAIQTQLNGKMPLAGSAGQAFSVGALTATGGIRATGNLTATGLSTEGFVGEIGYNGVWTGGGGPYDVHSIKANLSTGEIKHYAYTNFFHTLYSNGIERLRVNSSGNVLIGTATVVTGAKLEVYGSISATGLAVTGKISAASLPTSASGLSAGDMWRNGNVVNIV